MKLQLTAALLMVVVVAFTDAARGGRGGNWRERFEAFLARPICECNALESCVQEKEATCKSQCSSILTSAGADVDALEKCHELKKQAHEEKRACLEQELGPKCDDGSGVTDSPREEGSGGGRRGGGRRRGGKHGKGGKGHRRNHRGQIPEALKEYKKCVHECMKPEESENGGGRRHRGGKGRHGKGKNFAEMVCMKEAECRPVMYSRDAKMAAHEACKPAEGSVDHEAKFQAMCTCVKNAGFPDLDCSPAEEGGRKKRDDDDDGVDGAFGDSDEDDSGEDDSSEEDGN